MIRRPCLDCGRASDTTQGRCGPCRTARTKARDIARGTTTARGYDSRHDATRRRLLPLAYGTPCPRCGQTMTADQRLDLGHTVPLAVDPTSRGDRIEHAACNRGAR